MANNISYITVGATAMHSCSENFEMDGNSIRTCQTNGVWSGTAPVCKRELLNLLLTFIITV